jgi:hypothetical protein
MGKKVAKVVTAPVKVVTDVAKTVAKPVVKAVAPSKPKAAPVVAEEKKPTIKGRNLAAEAAAARRRARAGGGGLLAGVSIIGSEGTTGGLPSLGDTGLGIRRTDLGIPPEV